MRIFIFIVLVFLSFSARAQDIPDPLVTFTIHAEEGGLKENGTTTLAIEQNIAPHWHTYYKNPGDSGVATRITWDVPKGFELGPLQWPKPQTFQEGDLVTFGYAGRAILLQDITAPKDFLKDPVVLTATIEALVCKDICIPVFETKSITLNAQTENNATFFEQARAAMDPQAAPSFDMGIVIALGLAFLGGLILNLMPCVFPVLTLKALSFVKHAHSPHNALHGLAYTLGVVGSFVILAALLLAFKGAGAAVGWGFHLQEPWVVAVLAWLMFAVGLSLIDVLEISLPVSFSAPKGHGFISDVATGALVTIVATPCSAPFMATALGYALVQPAPIALAIFAALGCGLAAPYMLLTLVPNLARFLPKPGAWMENLRHFLAFPMFATALWLAWVLARQAGADAVALLLLGGLVLAFAAWVRRPYVLCAALCFLALIVAFLPIVRACNVPLAFGTAWSAHALQKILDEGKPAFVEVTADWCITCKVNHALALNRPEIKDLFAQKKITYLIADWTNRDPDITTYLTSFDRQGVPLYVYYPPGQAATPLVLPQILTGPNVIRKAIE